MRKKYVGDSKKNEISPNGQLHIGDKFDLKNKAQAQKNIPNLPNFPI